MNLFSTDLRFLSILAIDVILALGWAALQFLTLIQGIRWLDKSCNKNLTIYLIVSGVFPFAIAISLIFLKFVSSLDVPKYTRPQWRIALDIVYNRRYGGSYGAQHLAAPYRREPNTSEVHPDISHSDDRESRTSCSNTSFSFQERPPNRWYQPWNGPASGKNAKKVPMYEINGLYSTISSTTWYIDHPIVIALTFMIVIISALLCLAAVGWLIYGTILVSRSNGVQCNEPYKLALAAVIINWTVPIVVPLTYLIHIYYES